MKVRKVRWHTGLIDTLETETSNFVLNPKLHWKLVQCSEQCCCICMPGLTEDKSGCMILYALKLIQLSVRDTSKKRITVILPRENERNSKFVGSVSWHEGADFSNSAQLTEQNAAQVFNLRIHGQRFI